MSDEELVIKTSVEQLFAPLQRLLDQLLGPAATEVDLTLSDSLVWRFKRQLRSLREVKRLIEDSGKDVKPIATRLFSQCRKYGLYTGVLKIHHGKAIVLRERRSYPRSR